MKIDPTVFARLNESSLTPEVGCEGVALGCSDDKDARGSCVYFIGVGWVVVGGFDRADELVGLSCLTSSGRMQMRRASLHAFLESLDHTGTSTGSTQFSHWS